jgi:hypothetical protein
MERFTLLNRVTHPSAEGSLIYFLLFGEVTRLFLAIRQTAIFFTTLLGLFLPPAHLELGTSAANSISVEKTK